MHKAGKPSREETGGPMGWNTAGLLAEKVSIEVAVSALPDGPQPEGRSVSGYEALGSGLGIDYAIAQMGSWTVIADPHEPDRWQCPADLSRHGRYLSLLVNDVSTTSWSWSSASPIYG